MTPDAHLGELLDDPAVRPHPVLEFLEAAGRARSQEAYAAHHQAVFEALDGLDAQLAGQRFLGGVTPGPEDWALFVVLVRFDAVYAGLYKCNRQRLVDFAQLGPWLRDLWQRPGVAETIDLKAVQREAWAADPLLNPAGTIPVGLPDHGAPHDRWRFDVAERARVGTEESGHRRREGEFVRGRSGHRDVITADGSSGFRAEAGRYHLYVANNCPWCHRVAMARAVLGLQPSISMDVAYFRRDPERGWQLRPDLDGFGPDTVNGVTDITELYRRVGSNETSLPLLWDRRTSRVVNNESAELVRMFNDGFRHLGGGPDLYPAALADEIDQVNAIVYTTINNGAYKAGFSRDQATYERAYHRYFATLDWLDERLADRRFLCGDAVTEADLRLFPTVFRHDHVYYLRMKLNARRIGDYRHLARWRADVWAVEGVREASNLDHCKQGYFGRTGNQLVPVGPDLPGVLEDGP